MTTRPVEPTLGRSAFAAAFLSSIFPGLGHAYVRAWYRALGFAAAPILLIALLAGVGVNFRYELAGYLLQPQVLVALFIFNIVFLFYRLAAVADSYRVTTYLNDLAGAEAHRSPAERRNLRVLSLAGLLAVIAVLIGGHAAVAYYDLTTLEGVNAIFSPEDCRPDDQDCLNATPEPTESAPASSGPSATAGGSSPEPTDTGSAGSAGPTESPSETASLPPWDGRERLNILLIGSDRRPRQGSYNTDTLIVVSIDPASRKVAMFSLPRDTVDVPLPNIPARQVYGSLYGRKINSLWSAARGNPRLFPGGAYATLKATLGELYRLKIRYYVEVDFIGFRSVIDALGGVTINVQNPVVDDTYPSDSGTLLRIYIPTGIQHMNGRQALIYARSRHASSDFDRAARQQRVLLSVRAQADFGTLAANYVTLVKSLSRAVKTDIPPSLLPKLISLASSIDLANTRSFVFTPSYYQTERSNDPRGYVLIPNVSRIRTAVQRAFRFSAQDEERREALEAEGATIWVLNSSGTRDQATDVAAYLEHQGLAASAPNRRAAGTGLANTQIHVYNGAQDKLEKTLALLTAVFKVDYRAVQDPAVAVDVIITTGARTPDLTPPPIP